MSHTEIFELRREIAGLQGNVAAQESIIRLHNRAFSDKCAMVDKLHDEIESLRTTLKQCCCAEWDSSPYIVMISPDTNERLAAIGIKTYDCAIAEVLDVYDRVHSHERRERIAAKMHELWVKWTKNADNHNTVDRGFLFCPYEELNDIDKLALLRDADEILDMILVEG